MPRTNCARHSPFFTVRQNCCSPSPEAPKNIEKLFTSSMADAGQLHLMCEPLYINEVLEEACALVTSRARSKNIAIVRELNHEVAYSGDEAFLHQMFLIFLDNAIKYSPGTTQVRVT